MTEEGDLLNATGLNQCMYTGYENERLRNLKRELQSALSISDTLESQAEKQVSLHTISTKLTNVKDKLDKYFDEEPSGDELHQCVRDVTTTCRDILTTIKDLQLPNVKPRWCDVTDAGPAVGISNLEVRFRDAEMCQMFNSDYRNRIHRSRGDKVLIKPHLNCHGGRAISKP